jgi:hypothetical protein
VTEPAPGTTAEPPPEPRRRFDPLWPVLAGVGVGVAFVAGHRVRTGLYVVAGALAIAALLRLLLRSRAAALLVVRRRHVDVVFLAALATAIAVLAAVTPLRGGTG